MGSYFTIVTCRNSEDNISAALTSVIKQTLSPEYIIVINDGSTDKTKDILEDMQKDWPFLYVITNPDLGYDISRVVKNWNAALTLGRDRLLRKTDYHMIATDDTIYPRDYAEKIVRYMDSNPTVAVASGNYAMYKARAPIGAGRFIRNSFLDRSIWHGSYPEQMGYESAILYEAGLCGYSTKVIDDAKFKHIRPLGETHKFYEFGASMRTLGYHPIFAVGRFFVCLMAGGSMVSRTGAFYMLYYYLTYQPQYVGYNRMFHETLRSYVRANQVRRLKRIRIIPKFNIAKRHMFTTTTRS
jgi:glycosyltransferase involved in cell wall biosynthesis